MSIATTITLILLEAAYIFISLKAIIREKLSVAQNAFLFLGIIVANLGSMIFKGTPFRFLLVSALVFGVMCLACNGVRYYYNLIRIALKHGFRAVLDAQNGKVYFYSFFLIFAVYGVKYTFELLLLIFVVDDLSAITILQYIIVGCSLLIVPLALYLPTRRIVKYVDCLWHKENTFVIRWFLCILMILFIMVYLGMMIQTLNYMVVM